MNAGTQNSNGFRVLMVGTDVTTMGGIAAVVVDYMESGLMTRLGVEYLPTHRDGSRLGKMLFFARQLPKVVWRMRKAEILHIHTSYGWSFRRLVILLITGHFLGKKTVLHVHGSQFDKYFDNANWFESRLIRYGLRIADVVVALSSAWQDTLLAIEPKANVVVIRNGVRTDRKITSRRELHTPITILFLGRLGARKGVYDILEAIAQVDRSKFRFILAGDGDIEQVREIVKDRGYEECVTVPGWVLGDEKYQLLENADIYILPSYHEGLPISVLEAMAFGLPVISTEVGGIPDAITDGENGFLISPGDAGALADRIEKIGADPDLWRRLSESARARAVGEFSMDCVEAQIQQLYTNLVKD